ncbi:MAG TPA: biopolymer transporter ExbD [Gammaproteobacteria bacterium]|nr:biopolymer transporter ExbD [Gammaproteobacteria bacterium]
MKLRARKWEEPELNIINFVDVMLMLLVFFMMTTHFIQNTSLSVELPTASVAPASSALKGIEVTIDAQGHYYVNQQAVAGTSPEVVRAALLAAAGARRDVPIILRADARSSHQSVVTVMNVAGELGFSQLQILTTQPPAEN